MIVSNLSIAYPGKTPTLKHLNFKLKPGQWLGICGSNGSGKTTLLYCLAGLIPGHISATVKGKTLINQSVGIVFQNPDFSIFNLTVAEEVAFGANRPIEPALRSVGISRLKNSDPQTLSSGEKQKVCLAGVLARDPQIILLDEPVSQLDYKSALGLYQVLHQLHRQGKTIVTVEHDTKFLWQFTQKTLILDRGKIAAFGNTKNVLKRKSLLEKLGLKPL